MAALCLALHARYQCRHTGACCQHWTVPAEPHVVDIVESRKLRRPGFAGSLFLQASDGRVAVARDEHDECAFFDRAGGRLCVIHRDAGPDALPAACRHFPRKILRDRRGVLISLSHYCPTAASLLTGAGDLTVVDAGPPLELAAPIEGLEAADALPPLLRPGLLCDMEGYAAWEACGVATFARDDLTFRECVDVIAAATEEIRGWRPGTASLATLVASAFRAADQRLGRDDGADTRAIDTARVLSAGRAGRLDPIDRFEQVWQAQVGDQGSAFDRVMKNYLAARLFANWIAYQGRGLRTIVEWLRTCAAVVLHSMAERTTHGGSTSEDHPGVEAVRAADLLLLHVIDSAAFAKHVASMEGAGPR